MFLESGQSNKRFITSKLQCLYCMSSYSMYSNRDGKHTNNFNQHKELIIHLKTNMLTFNSSLQDFFVVLIIVCF